MYVCRYLVNPDQTLQIHYVTAQDAGRYTCTAANDVGVVTANAQLLVEGKSLSEELDFTKISCIYLSFYLCPQTNK